MKGLFSGLLSPSGGGRGQVRRLGGGGGGTALEGFPGPLVNMSQISEVPESAAAIDRAKILATSKSKLQRLVFLRELPVICHEIGLTGFSEGLLPLLQELFADPNMEVRREAATVIGHEITPFCMRADPEAGQKVVTKNVLPLLQRALRDTSHDVRFAANKSLVALTPHLSPAERGMTVLTTALSLAHDNPDDLGLRSSAVWLLTSLAEALGKELCQQFVAPEVRCLAEDSALDVRTAAAKQFTEVCSVVGPEYTKTKLLLPFTKLTKDTDVQVRVAAVQSIVKVSQSVPLAVRINSLVNLMQAFLTDHDEVVRCASQSQLGPFLATLYRDDMSSDSDDDDDDGEDDDDASGADGRRRRRRHSLVHLPLAPRETPQPLSPTSEIARDSNISLSSSRNNQGVASVVSEKTSLPSSSWRLAVGSLEGPPPVDSLTAAGALPPFAPPRGKTGHTTAAASDSLIAADIVELPICLSTHDNDAIDDEDKNDQGRHDAHSAAPHDGHRSTDNDGNEKANNNIIATSIDDNHPPSSSSSQQPTAEASTSSTARRPREERGGPSRGRHEEVLFFPTTLLQDFLSFATLPGSGASSGSHSGLCLSDSSSSSPSSSSSSSSSWSSGFGVPFSLFRNSLAPPAAAVSPAAIFQMTTAHEGAALGGANEPAAHCAYSFAGVLAVVGVQRWSLFRKPLAALARHRSPRVRRSIAASFHVIVATLFRGFDISATTSMDDPASARFWDTVAHQLETADSSSLNSPRRASCDFFRSSSSFSTTRTLSFDSSSPADMGGQAGRAASSPRASGNSRSATSLRTNFSKNLHTPPQPPQHSSNTGAVTPKKFYSSSSSLGSEEAGSRRSSRSVDMSKSTGSARPGVAPIGIPPHLGDAGSNSTGALDDLGAVSQLMHEKVADDFTTARKVAICRSLLKLYENLLKDSNPIVANGALASFVGVLEQLPDGLWKNFLLQLRTLVDLAEGNNWRTRQAIASLIEPLCARAADPEVVRQFIVPLTFRLACDEVAIIRETIIPAIGPLLKSGCPEIWAYFDAGGSVRGPLPTAEEVFNIQNATARVCRRRLLRVKDALAAQRSELRTSSVPKLVNPVTGTSVSICASPARRPAVGLSPAYRASGKRSADRTSASAAAASGGAEGPSASVVGEDKASSSSSSSSCLLLDADCVPGKSGSSSSGDTTTQSSNGGEANGTTGDGEDRQVTDSSAKFAGGDTNLSSGLLDDGGGADHDHHFGNHVADGCGESNESAAAAMTEAAPDLLHGPEVGIIRSLLQTFAKSESYLGRQSYVYFCERLLREMPKVMFELYFLRNLSFLAFDSVHNVRIAWALCVVPHIKAGCKLARNGLIISISQNLEMLPSTEDVVAAARASANELNALRPVTSSSTLSGRGPGSPILTGRPRSSPASSSAKAPSTLALLNGMTSRGGDGSSDLLDVELPEAILAGVEAPPAAPLPVGEGLDIIGGLEFPEGLELEDLLKAATFGDPDAVRRPDSSRSALSSSESFGRKLSSSSLSSMSMGTPPADSPAVLTGPQSEEPRDERMGLGLDVVEDEKRIGANGDLEELLLGGGGDSSDDNSDADGAVLADRYSNLLLDATPPAAPMAADGEKATSLSTPRPRQQDIDARPKLLLDDDDEDGGRVGMDAKSPGEESCSRAFATSSVSTAGGEGDAIDALETNGETEKQMKDVETKRAATSGEEGAPVVADDETGHQTAKGEECPGELGLSSQEKGTIGGNEDDNAGKHVRTANEVDGKGGPLDDKFPHSEDDDDDDLLTGTLVDSDGGIPSQLPQDTTTTPTSTGAGVDGQNSSELLL